MSVAMLFWVQYHWRLDHDFFLFFRVYCFLLVDIVVLLAAWPRVFNRKPMRLLRLFCQVLSEFDIDDRLMLTWDQPRTSLDLHFLALLMLKLDFLVL